MTLPTSWTQALPDPDRAFIERAVAHQATLTKPPGSLGRLEQLAIDLCGQQAREQPSVDRVHISIFAADHGVCEEGISAFPQAVTAQMIANFANGGAAISVLAKSLGASLEVVNLGTVGDTPADLPGVIDLQIAPSTVNMAKAPAMTPEQLASALQAGDQAAQRASDNGAELFIAGDMGIGNTTAAAALACALLEASPEELAGAGTGLTPEGVAHKASVVNKAISRHGADREPANILASLGGFEIAAITGAFLGAAQRRMPILVDGFIASVAALVAMRQQPSLINWLHFGHRSAERGHQRVLAAMQAKPLLDLGMRLGEASGAAVAVPLMRQACALHNQMASFADAGVSDGS
ncbi:nicotinate-nucleotide--dimethylbenzimidazole phosphoribosyltransferase [Marinobacter nanhaiticus D15-8W]|uniref:Nicotinate-nucleotide--dimethylbenzimidazole phosphoribosyltransferase n=1 Tax=Marinobacter nanhaiticus D15-8W TaxID=626887 RepID=N6WRJ4_9GAMM|nr:nicotinate-nucleotide--dimethylbenzimidazole phosphoribosyltransferase [Marinobacter nanhaiticus]ENO14171.1 nicotinate-nucleotide--dimethylbenzimidazole phosphoribosyltransferase [Marinobacter nanhaiticus D15-8W]BES71556.1 nicotinate-nucleotide--dimethylbenzimidazole phosphoribosyltransferase [Marinobacter nanhaiticus D15-8W]